VSWSSVFQRLTTLSEKEWRRTFDLQRCLINFNEWPRVLPSVCNSTYFESGMGDRLFAILRTSIRSARFLPSSSVQSHSLARRSSYIKRCNPGINLVNRCWIRSNVLLSFTQWRSSKDTILNVRPNQCLVQIDHYQKSFVNNISSIRLAFENALLH